MYINQTLLSLLKSRNCSVIMWCGPGSYS